VRGRERCGAPADPRVQRLTAPRHQVKRYNAGDGMFFQWVMCCGILTVGIFVQLATGSPQFEVVRHRP
jgi:hypothetical protein